MKQDESNGAGSLHFGRDDKGEQIPSAGKPQFPFKKGAFEQEDKGGKDGNEGSVLELLKGMSAKIIQIMK